MKSVMNSTEENIDSIQDLTKEEIDRKEAEMYLKDASRTGITLADRKRNVNSALKILFGLYKEQNGDLTSASFLTIARAYYLASITILPKGTTIPEKKKEALKKGIIFIEKINSSMSVATDLCKDVYRIKSMLSIEYNRIDREKYDDESLKKRLKEAVAKGCTDFENYEWDIQIAVRLCELGVDMKVHFGNLIKSKEANDLQKAKAYYFIKREDDNVKEHMDKCISSLRDRDKRCSHPLWEETVDFIKLLKDEKYPLWKDFAIAAYESCRVQEKNTDALRLRWYWSRHRVLYDIAFLAAKEQADNAQNEEAKKAKIKQMAEISDSQKSRFSLRLSDLEKMAKSDDEFKKPLDAYVTTHQDAFVKRFSDVGNGTGKASDYSELSPRTKPPELTDAPKGWVVVHFYLNRLEQNGYAIVYNKDTETWQYKPFKDNSYKELFSDFLTWQTNYNLYKNDAAEHLVTLCKKIGKTMPFLFEDGFIPSNKNVLFIPHDFLHRLPLHGAIEEGTSDVFLVNHACCYLPAWSFVEKSSLVQGDNNQSQSVADQAKQQCILLKNFEEHNQEYFKDIVKMEWDLSKKGASCVDLKKVNSPELLVILCHGSADMANPFRSTLELKNDGITYLEILKSVEGVKGSHIILGACETDLVPPLSDIIDEHTSVANTFLIKNAKGILATMWEAFDDKITDVVKKMYNKNLNSSMVKELQIWQKAGAESYRDNKDVSAFYDTVVFRVVGLCIWVKAL